MKASPYKPRCVGGERLLLFSQPFPSSSRTSVSRSLGLPTFSRLPCRTRSEWPPRPPLLPLPVLPPQSLHLGRRVAALTVLRQVNQSLRVRPQVSSSPSDRRMPRLANLAQPDGAELLALLDRVPRGMLRSRVNPDLGHVLIMFPVVQRSG
ncbi:hypothetical protein B296_00015341 [Ensete ventricosum]|uniref:Uncharacterized protein n=1 Tax=Ensete ventricosum TaxID=4639 RepID=A0A426YYW1_ENSVE|nr:hypothetical protein B296_00015341 [Ensete ventricosum]